MDDINKIRKKIHQINQMNSFENQKVEFYSLVVLFVLSKEIFKNNSDLGSFLENSDINFKEYVLKSRTLTLARLIREVEGFSDIKKMSQLINNLKKLSENEKENEKEKSDKNKQKTNDDYYKKLKEKYIDGGKSNG